MIPTHYLDEANAERMVRLGRHREYIGGLWDELGQLQFDTLVAAGLEPGMRLLDLGCGCLRAGIRLVAYLQPGHYYGVDASQALLDCGYDVELAGAGLTDRLPRRNLLAEADFNVDRLGTTFDVAIAQSLFTHLPQAYLRLCLLRLAGSMRPGARFFATFFLCADDREWAAEAPRAGGLIVTRPVSDPFHYRVADLHHAAAGLPWSVDVVEEWDHPRGQQLVVFTRVNEPAT